MIAALATIEGCLKSLGRSKLLDALGDGTSKNDVREALAQFDLASLDELEALLGWHDGTVTDSGATLGDIWLFPGFYLLSLADACAHYEAFRGDPRWTPGWWPVFANGGGDFYVVELDARSRGCVRHFRFEEHDHPGEFDSLSLMVETLASAFEQGVFFVDEGGYLDMHDDEFAALAARLNPDVPRWQG